MAEFVNPILEITKCLWPYCEKHMRYLSELQENKDSLSNTMNRLKEGRDDVHRRVVEEEKGPNEPKRCTEQVRGWIKRVDTIEGEVEKMLQKADAQLSRARCLGGCSPANNCCSKYKLGRSIAKKKPLVVELMEERNFVEVTYILPPLRVQTMNLEPIVGMDSMLEKVWKHITSKDDKKGNIIGLYGHGGVGKTTLLKKINNKFVSEDDFDHIVMFVVVSTPINYEAIQNKIGERLGLSLQGDRDESSRAEKIFNQLKNKRFVILLDDIWERVELQRIGIPILPQQGNSSKVIFTTRNKEVCGLMEATSKFRFKVECLPWDDAWNLFQKKVGEEALNCFPGARKSAKVVAKKCGGLPLALITIGLAMSTKTSVEEWKDAITTLRNYAAKFPGMVDILPRLKLSYDYLGDETIKSCFLYCALYPQDHPIREAKLIDYWIGEGFLNGFDTLDENRNHGHTIIETLKKAHLLEIHEVETYVKMHDIIRDLALWIVNDCSKTTTGRFLVASNVSEKWSNTERIFWITDSESEEPPPSPNPNLQTLLPSPPPPSPNLKTLLLRRITYKNLPQNFFQSTPSLRVLDMSNSTQLEKLPTSICQLYELQYLNLSDTKIKELPIELKNLIKLKFLDLSDAKDLKKIPSGVIADHSELQVLKLAGSGFKDWGLKEEDGDGVFISLSELERLKQLQEVTLNISTPVALEELLRYHKLRSVCITLVLMSCVNLRSISLLPLSSTTSKGGLGNLPSLKYLHIHGCLELDDEGGETNTTTTTSAAAGLPISINNKLERNYSKHLPRLNNIVLGKNLYVITIRSCNALKDLTWVVYVENLEKLYVDNCEGLETIMELDDDGLEEGPSGGCRVFKNLKSLRLLNLPNLKSICSHALAFPSIETIRISGCKKLKKLPLDSGSNFNKTLQVIRAEPSWWSELQWEDETIKSIFDPYLNKGY